MELKTDQWGRFGGVLSRAEQVGCNARHRAIRILLKCTKEFERCVSGYLTQRLCEPRTTSFGGIRRSESGFERSKYLGSGNMGCRDDPKGLCSLDIAGASHNELDQAFDCCRCPASSKSKGRSVANGGCRVGEEGDDHRGRLGPCEFCERSEGASATRRIVTRELWRKGCWSVDATQESPTKCTRRVYLWLIE